MSPFSRPLKRVFGCLLVVVSMLLGCALGERKILVPFPAVSVTGVAFATPANNPASVSYLLGGGSQTVAVRIFPQNAANLGVHWKVDHPERLTLTPHGTSATITEATAAAGDQAVITATTADGGFVATCTVTFTNQTILAKAIKFIPNTLTFHPGEQPQISPVFIDPQTGLAQNPQPTNVTLTWTGGDSNVTVSPAPGIPSAAATLSAAANTSVPVTITATTADGTALQAQIAVTVTTAVSLIHLSQPALGLWPNESAALTATTTPIGSPVQWLLISGTGGTVDPTTGVVTAGGSPGTFVVTAKTLDGSVSADNPCTVTVYDPNSTSNPVPQVGTSLTSATLTNTGATMAVDPSNGAVYIAYADNSGNATIQRADFGVKAWNSVGGSLTGNSNPVLVTTSRTQNLSLAVNLGTPYIAYVEGGTSFQFPFVKQVDGGGNWANVGTGLISSGSATYLSLAFDTSGAPFLGFVDNGSSPPNKVSTVLLGGGSWNSIGGNSKAFSNASSSYSVVAYDATHTLAGTGGTPSSGDYYTALFNQGTQAEILNFPAALVAFPPLASMSYSDMTIQNGKLYLSYRDGSTGNPVLFIHTGSTNETHVMDGTTTEGFYTSVAVDPRNGTAYVAYADNSNLLRVSKLDAGAAAGASGSVIINNPADTVNAIKLAFYVEPTGQGHLYVCYGLDGVSGSGGVVVKDFAR